MLVIVFAIGMLFGLLNSFLIVRLKITPFLATLGTMIIGRGLGQIISKSYIVYIPKQIVSLGAKRFLGLPVPIVIFLLIVAVAFIVLKTTKFGRSEGSGHTLPSESGRRRGSGSRMNS